MQTNLTNQDLIEIRDAVPHLDLVAIRALRRAGFDIVHREPEVTPARTLWTSIPCPMTPAALRPDHATPAAAA